MNSLGELVKKWRSASGLNAAQMASRVGGSVSRQSIEQLEAGAVQMPRYLPRLAKAMGCSIDDLIALRMPAPLKADQRAEPEPARKPSQGAWPFYTIDRATFESLSDDQRGFVEHAVLQALRDCKRGLQPAAHWSAGVADMADFFATRFEAEAMSATEQAAVLAVARFAGGEEIEHQVSLRPAASAAEQQSQQPKRKRAHTR
jgi:transcriptional regulator with XRE-family HTH domain